MVAFSIHGMDLPAFPNPSRKMLSGAAARQSGSDKRVDRLDVQGEALRGPMILALRGKMPSYTTVNTAA